MRQLEVSACRSGLRLTLRGARPCFSGEIRRDLKPLILRLNWFQADILTRPRTHGWTET